ncbi:MAG: hypothetical protein Q9206_003198 [Seirophora lacunosa]|nr:MAG: hypothetical protein LQ344_006527 [Seirophora lacunosa]
MVPIYATVSFLSYVFYYHAIYFEVIRDCYEAFAIASFFALLCHYIAPDLHNQKDFFRGLKPRTWIIYFGVFQYCFVRVTMTIVAVITEAAGRYCLNSLNPAFAHVWAILFEASCVTVAMYCLIQFYVQLRDDLAEHRPLLKVAAIKLVIFLSFWQTILISLLTSTGAIKASRRFQEPDIRIGIPALLLCTEMALFSIFHLFAFPWQVYDIRRSAIVASESAPGFLPDPNTAYVGGPYGTKALIDAFNPWDLIKAIGRGFRWFAVGRRRREEDISYQSYKISRPVNVNSSSDVAVSDGMSIPTGTYVPGGSNTHGRYHQLKHGDFDDDNRRLLSHQQAVPLSESANVYPRPGMRLPDDSERAANLYDAPTHSISPTNHPRHHPDPYLRPPYPDSQHQQALGIIDPTAGQDTAYHGASIASSSHRHPSPQILYPPQRHSFASTFTTTSNSDDDWADWSGAHGPHNQSDVARLSAEHIDRARLSAEHEARSRTASEERHPQAAEGGENDRRLSPSELWQGMQGHGRHRSEEA